MTSLPFKATGDPLTDYMVDATFGMAAAASGAAVKKVMTPSQPGQSSPTRSFSSKLPIKKTNNIVSKRHTGTGFGGGMNSGSLSFGSINRSFSMVLFA